MLGSILSNFQSDNFFSVFLCLLSIFFKSSDGGSCSGLIPLFSR